MASAAGTGFAPQFSSNCADFSQLLLHESLQRRKMIRVAAESHPILEYDRTLENTLEVGET
jgi:hypothetical protein